MSSQENKLPTAEEILRERCNIDRTDILHPIKSVIENVDESIHEVIECMEEHTRLHTSPLQARISELEKELAKAQHEKDIISTEALRLKKDNEVFLEKKQELLNKVCMVNATLSEENQRLREALEKISLTGISRLVQPKKY